MQLCEEEDNVRVSRIIFSFFLLQLSVECKEKEDTSLVFWCNVVAQRG
jgi:hypothetical protein